MRIFYASDTTPNSAFESNLWRNNLYLPLKDLRHDVVEFKYDLRKTFQNLNPVDPIQKHFIKKNRPKISRELLRQIKKAHTEKPIDLFFSYFFDACVQPDTIEQIKAMGIKTINWYCNGSYQLNLVSEISPHYDYCLVPEKFRLYDYKALGANPIYCQEAANPNIYKPYETPYRYDVSFIGQAYGERPDYIKHLIDNGIDAHAWGIGWQAFTTPTIQNQQNKTNALQTYLAKAKKLFTPDGIKALQYRWYYLWHPEQKKLLQKSIAISSKAILPAKAVGPVLSDIDMINLYSQSKINLGFSTCGNTHKDKKRIMQIRLRDFEIPMSGGFYMTEYMEELEEFFDIGKEVICYHDKNDLVRKIKYYLAHEQEREKIRLAGRERCLRDHTWHKRFQMVFEKVF